MAESMKGLHRSHRCTEVSSANIGEKVTVMGWVQKRRNLGSLIFIDLRDRSGLLQIVFDEESVGAEGFAKAGTLRSEYVVAVEGTVQKRSAAVNENLKTGDIEVIATSLRILSESQTPPFAIEENSQTKEDIRLKYRYLDLRRPDLQRNLILRSRVAAISLAAARRVATTSRAAPRPPPRRPLRRLRRTARCLALATRPSRWSWDCWLQLPQCLALLSSCASVLVARLDHAARCLGYRRS